MQMNMRKKLQKCIQYQTLVNAIAEAYWVADQQGNQEAKLFLLDAIKNMQKEKFNVYENFFCNDTVYFGNCANLTDAIQTFLLKITKIKEGDKRSFDFIIKQQEDKTLKAYMY